MESPGESYTRRVCAVLIADVSAFMGENDERADSIPTIQLEYAF